MKNEVRLSLENLTYNLIVNNSEELQFILPRRVPTAEITEKEQNVFMPANQTEIAVYTKVVTTSAPTVSIISEDEGVDVTVSGSLELFPNSSCILSFITVDGGNSWIVSSSIASSETAEGAEEIAKNAQQIAITANETATAANETANTAKETANTANTVATEAQEAANTANTDIVSVKENISGLQTSVSTLNETLTQTTETANTALTTANNVNEAVNTAITTAGEAKTTAEAAATTAGEAKTTAETATSNASSALNTANEAKTAADASIKISAEGTQTINSNFAIGTGMKGLVTRADGVTQINSVSVNKYDDIGLEQLEVGSTTVPMCLNHCGTTEGEGIDKHIRVDCKESATSATIKEQLAYLSDLETKINEIRTELEGYLQLTSSDTQFINSDVVLDSTKKFLVQKHDDSTYIGMFVGYYSELPLVSEEGTAIPDTGLEQLEIGSPKLLMCLNHCGATFMKDGEVTTVDKHIRVDYKETPDSPTVQDQLAYMSDIKALEDRIAALESKEQA